MLLKNYICSTSSKHFKYALRLFFLKDVLFPLTLILELTTQ